MCVQRDLDHVEVVLRVKAATFGIRELRYCSVVVLAPETMAGSAFNGQQHWPIW